MVGIWAFEGGLSRWNVKRIFRALVQPVPEAQEDIDGLINGILGNT